MAPLALNMIDARALNLDDADGAKRDQRERQRRGFISASGSARGTIEKHFASAESAIQGIGYRLVCVSTCNVADSTTDHGCRSDSALRDLVPRRTPGRRWRIAWDELM